MNTAVLVNGEASRVVDAFDRGMQYGDGLFETILIEAGRAIFIDEHLNRLEKGCNVLRFPLLDRRILLEEINQLIAHQPFGVVKIVLSRGVGERGFFAPVDLTVTRILLFEERNKSVLKSHKPKRLRVCDMRLANQPMLAGIKHLNQLERVQARNEWHEKEIHEGLMMDFQGNVVEGTMSNIFIAKNDCLKTPPLEQAGVKGIVRQFLIDTARQSELKLAICTLSLEDVLDADEVFMSNSLMPIWFISAIKNKRETIKMTPGRFSYWAKEVLRDEIERQIKA